jgi:hypothetical protein
MTDRIFDETTTRDDEWEKAERDKKIRVVYSIIAVM